MMNMEKLEICRKGLCRRQSKEQTVKISVSNEITLKLFFIFIDLLILFNFFCLFVLSVKNSLDVTDGILTILTLPDLIYSKYCQYCFVIIRDSHLLINK